MINNVNSGISMPPPPSRTQQNLTEEQQTFVTDTLAEFDADELSEEDALSIIDMFSQADIQPGAALEKVMSSAGFDANGDYRIFKDGSYIVLRNVSYSKSPEQWGAVGNGITDDTVAIQHSVNHCKGSNSSVLEFK